MWNAEWGIERPFPQSEFRIPKWVGGPVVSRCQLFATGLLLGLSLTTIPGPVVGQPPGPKPNLGPWAPSGDPPPPPPVHNLDALAAPMPGPPVSTVIASSRDMPRVVASDVPLPDDGLAPPRQGKQSPANPKKNEGVR